MYAVSNLILLWILGLFLCPVMNLLSTITVDLNYIITLKNQVHTLTLYRTGVKFKFTKNHLLHIILTVRQNLSKKDGTFHRNFFKE